MGPGAGPEPIDRRGGGREDAIFVERVRLILDAAPLALGVTVLNGGVLAYVQRGLVPTGWLLLWLGVLVAVTAVRFADVVTCRRSPLSVADARRCVRRIAAGAGFSGGLWGLAAVLFFPPRSLAHMGFLSFVFGGMVAGAAGSYAALRRAFFAFALPALVPLIVRLLLTGQELPVAMGIMALVFLGGMSAAVARGHATTLASLRLRWETADLLATLRAERDRTSRVNQELAGEIAEREAVERELRAHRERLEELVRERTADLERAYRRLSQAKEEWEDTFDAVPDCVAIVDPDCRIRRLNRAMARRLGVEPSEAVGRRCHEAIHGADRPPDRCPHALLLADGVAHTGETYEAHTDTHFLVSALPLSGREGGSPGALVVARDVTQLKRAEQEVLAERNRLAVTLESIGDGVIATEASGRITRMNRVAEELTGWRRTEALDRPVGELLRLVDEHGRRVLPCPVGEVIATGRPASHNAAVLTARDGTERTASFRAAPIRDRQGAFLGAVLVVRDTTRERKLEQDLARAEHIEALGVLAGGIAHDFNNILMGIATNVAVARQARGDEEKRQRLLSRAEDGCFRASELTQELLTFARGGEPSRAVVDLSSELPGWVVFALRGSRVVAETSCAPGLLPVEGDPRQIRQVINNLVINAQQAMPRGGAVRVRAANERVGPDADEQLSPGDYVRITVEDEGPGIAPENRERIFHPYFTTKAEGSGLGLATAYSITRRHGGSIDVASRPGGGSVFTVRLPALEEDARPRPDEAGAEAASGGRILVMDDEPSIREVLAEVLPQLGYEAEFAADGAAAVEAYASALSEKRSFDAVLLDLTVPGGMGGREALERLRELDPDVAAIASSGYADDPVLADPACHGFRDRVAKPYRVRDLAEVLGRVIGATHASS